MKQENQCKLWKEDDSIVINSKIKTKQVFLTCQYCGTQISIFRRKSRLKPDHHIKHMWCHVCKKVTPHEELHEFSPDQDFFNWRSHRYAYAGKAI